MTARATRDGVPARTFVVRRGERLNGYTHLLGLVAACVGAAWLLARWPHAHGVWHLFVLGGTIVHYLTVARLVLQTKG